MIRRVLQSGIVLALAFCLGIQARGASVGGEENTAIISVDYASRDDVVTNLIECVDLESVEIEQPAEIVEKQVTEVALEGSNSPFKGFSTYETYISMGYTEERFTDDLELLGLLCIAEAENQSELGKRLVIDTVLNRMDSEKWHSDTIRDVIFRPNQYTSVWNGRIDRVELTDDVCRLVEEEIKSRTNYDVIYFNTGGYSYSTAIMQEGDHYFCGDI